MKAKDILYKEVRKDFKIDDGGRLFRRLKSGVWKEVKIKDNSGCGYCQVGWRNKMYKVHRILYSLYHEKDVDSNLMIDHINGDKLDNTKDNLRLVTNRQNQQNRVTHRNGNLQGSRLHKSGKFQALIQIRGKTIGLGVYQTEKQAHEVYLQACEMVDYKTVDEIKEHFGVARFTSEFKGVSFHKARNKYQAYITINGKKKHLGLFTTELEAAEAVAR